MLNSFCRKFRAFFPPLWTIVWIFWRFGETFAGIVPASKFCLVGGALFGARALQKTPGQRFRGLFPRSGPVQHILLDIDDDEDDEYEGNQKDDEDDEDADEDDNG